MTEKKEERKRLFCPYCDEEMVAVDLSCCQACGVTVFYCPKCREPVAREKRVCPHCGAEIKEEKPDG